MDSSALTLVAVCFVMLCLATAAKADPSAPVARPIAHVSTNVVSTNVISTVVAKELESKWGIQITALRISAGGNVIDFRYRITDAAKAATLGNPKSKTELLDRASGKSLHVPSTKVGTMRSTGQRIANGKTCTALFGNPGKLVKAGSKVDIIIGDFRADNLTVGE